MGEMRGVDGEKGCEYGHMNREKIGDINNDLSKIEKKVENYSKMINRAQWLLIGCLTTMVLNFIMVMLKVKAG